MSTSYRTPFVGIGTGRCGTTSLSVIVGACKKTICTHERYQLSWYEVNEEHGRLIRQFRESAENGILIGDVGCSLVTGIGHFRSSIPKLKVICLHRDKNETVESFRKFGWQKLRPDDKRAWLDRCYSSNGHFTATVIKAFPIIDAINADQACGFYWEFYEALMAKIAEPVIHIRTEELSQNLTLEKIFDFLEIPNSDRVYVEDRKLFTSEYVEEKKKEIMRGTPR